MAIDVQIVGERNDVIEQLLDFDSVLDKNLNSKFSKRYKLLKYVDPVGNTIFNHLQVGILIEDLELLKKKLKADKEIAFIDNLIKLVKNSLKAPHLFVKFIGD